MKIKKHIISSLILLSSFTNLNAQIKNINTDNEKKFEEYLGLEIMKNTYKFSKKDENDAKHYYQRFMQIKGNKKLDFLELMRNYQAGISPENYTYPIDTEKPNAIVYIAQYDHFIKNKTEIGNSYNTAEYFSFLQDLNIYYDLEIKVIRNKDEILKNLSNKKKQSLDLICFSAHTTNDKKKQKQIKFGYKNLESSYLKLEDLTDLSKQITEKVKKNGVIFGYSCSFGEEFAPKIDSLTKNEYIVIGSKTDFTNHEIKLKNLYPLILTIKNEKNMYRGHDYIKKLWTYKKK